MDAPAITAASLRQALASGHEMLAHGMALYDALYSWCKKGKAETHTWNPGLYK